MKSERVILFVEDDPDDRELALRALRRSRIANEIVVARNGAEALDYLFGTGAWAGRDTTLLPQVVLLDLKLPKIDGLEVLRKCRADERTRTLPIVVLTSTDDDHDVIASYDLGAGSYVRKPVDCANFAAAVEQLGMYWLLLNECATGRRVPA
jgi:CheY-like chemotaxis protein